LKTLDVKRVTPSDDKSLRSFHKTPRLFPQSQKTALGRVEHPGQRFFPAWESLNVVEDMSDEITGRTVISE
jgi:hypothetical protein